jgi:O-succinylbenzoic acid--CoA ligase
VNCGKVLRQRELNIAKDGEILVRGNTLFQGYVEGDSVCLAVDEQGWFHTGDIGRLDDKGNLVVFGRKDNMFISGGENVYPEEIESWLKSVKGIDDAVVVGLEDSEFGHRPSAFVKFSDENRMSADEIVHSLEKFLPRFKIPRSYFDWPEEKVSESLKPNRRELQVLAKGLSVSREQPSQKVSS